MTIPSGPYIPLPDNTEIIKQRVQSTALNTLKLNDSELGGSGEVVTIQSLNGAVEIFTESGSINDSLVRASAMQAYAQPLDSDLTAIAALSTTAYGRSLLVLANQAALQAAVGATGGTWGSITGTLSSQTDLQTALNAKVTSGGALGTPSSGTVTNLTGTASININGTVGATTPTTVAATTVTASGAIQANGNMVAIGSEQTGNITGRIRVGSGTAGIYATGGGASVIDGGNGSPALLASETSLSVWSNRPFRWANTNWVGDYLQNATFGTQLSRQSDGVVQIGTTSANALGSLACANVTASGTVTANEVKVTGSQSIGVYSSGSNRTGLFFDGGGGSIRLLLASGGYFGIGSSTTDANTGDTFKSRKSAGVWRLGTTTTGEDGSLVCALVTAGLAATPGTFAVVNATTATATLGLRRITDRSNRLAYPDGTNWRFVSDDAIIS